MTTSGSIDFSVSRNDLIKVALQHIGVLQEGGTPTSDQYTELSTILNLIVKARMADGMPLWALKQGYILPTSSVNSINMASDGGHFTNSYVSTTTSAASSSGGSTITVSSTTGIANGYYIGVVLDDTTVQWTTVNGAPAGSVVTLTAALTAAVSSGAIVYCYQTKANRPLRILDAYLKYTTSGSRHQIRPVNKDDFYSLGNLTTASIPNQWFYDPQLATGVFYFYPRFSGGDNVIEVTYHRPFEDFDAAADTPDFPQEWFLPLMLELAALSGPKYGVSREERKSLFEEAAFYIGQALSNGTSEQSIRIVPEWW